MPLYFFQLGTQFAPSLPANLQWTRPRELFTNRQNLNLSDYIAVLRRSTVHCFWAFAHFNLTIFCVAVSKGRLCPNVFDMFISWSYLHNVFLKWVMKDQKWRCVLISGWKQINFYLQARRLYDVPGLSTFFIYNSGESYSYFGRLAFVYYDYTRWCNGKFRHIGAVKFNHTFLPFRDIAFSAHFIRSCDAIFWSVV